MQAKISFDIYDNLHLAGWLFASDGPFSLVPSAREWFDKYDHPSSRIGGQTRRGWFGYRSINGFLFQGDVTFTVPFKDNLTADDIVLEYYRKIAGVEGFADRLIAKFHQQWAEMGLPATVVRRDGRPNEAFGLSVEELTARVKAAKDNPVPAKPIDEMVEDAKKILEMQELHRQKHGKPEYFTATIHPDQPGMTRIEGFLTLGGNLRSTTWPPPPLAEWAFYDNIIIEYRKKADSNAEKELSEAKAS